MKKSLLTLLIVGAILAWFATRNQADEPDVKEVYVQNCASCHAEDLSGGSGSSLLDDEWNHGSSDEAIAAAIRDGIPTMGMPAWGAALDEQQIRALVIYIREQQAEAGNAALMSRFDVTDGVYKTKDHSYTLEELARTDGMLWSLDFLPDNSMLVTQRDGILWHIIDGEPTRIENTPEVWADGQGGLLEVQLHPAFEQNGWIYLSFSETTGVEDEGKTAGMTTVVRGRIVQDQWVDEEVLYRADEALHIATAFHFGSRFVFDNGYLFFAIGDRGRQDQAQDLSLPNGKIHRIHDDGRIPDDNPFLDTPDALPTIWSYGHRNPQGMDRDPLTGALWATEHGPRGGDELNRVEKGKNYGWPVITYGMNYNGTPITSETHREGMEQPALYWVPSIAVAGMDFYEGSLFPLWQGKLLVSGMSSGELHLVTIENDAVTEDEILLKGKGRIRDVTSGPDGAIYLLLNSRDPKTGKVVRMMPN